MTEKVELTTKTVQHMVIYDINTPDTPYSLNFIENMKIFAEILIDIINNIIIIDNVGDVVKYLYATNLHKPINQTLILMFKSNELRNLILLNSFEILIIILKNNSNLNKLQMFSEFWYKDFLADRFISLSNDYLQVLSWNIFGCYNSTDIDICVMVDSPDFIKNINKNELLLDIQSIMDINNREIDYNLCYFDGKYYIFQKGSNLMTQNIVSLTYKYHKQKYPAIFTDLSHNNLTINEIFPFCNKFILEKSKILIGNNNYNEIIRKSKISLFHTYGIEYIQLIRLILSNIIEINTKIWKDIFKTLIMKIIQTIIVYNNILLEYTKPELIITFEKLYPNTQQLLLYAFTRTLNGIFDKNILFQIINVYSNILIENYNNNRLEWFLLPQIDLTNNPTLFSNELFQLFIQSPIELTDEFWNKYIQFNNNYNINNNSNNSNNNNESFNLSNYVNIVCNGFEYLPNNLQSFVFNMNQRTNEWKQLLNTYQCGRNSAVTSELLENPKWLYNLFRGSIVELMIINSQILNEYLLNYFGFDTKQVTIGLMVESLEPHSIGCSPDMLIVTNAMNVIPIEIKCLQEKPNLFNHHYRRAIDLATKQLTTAINIITKHTNQTLRIGLILIVYVYEDSNGTHFDSYISQIEFNQ